MRHGPRQQPVQNGAALAGHLGDAVRQIGHENATPSLPNQDAEILQLGAGSLDRRRRESKVGCKLPHGWERHPRLPEVQTDQVGNLVFELEMQRQPFVEDLSV